MAAGRLSPGSKGGYGDRRSRWIELDILEQPVGFRGQTFDVVVAQGLFEYAGTFMKVSQARLTFNVPVISPVLAVDHFYVCAPLA